MTENQRLGIVLTLVFGICASLILFQAYTLLLPITIYIAMLCVNIAAILVAIFFGSEVLAIGGTLVFALAIRTVYLVSTRFQVLPSGDSYGQYAVFQVFAQSGHTGIISSNSNLVTALQGYMSYTIISYSQWPGFEIFAIYFARMTGIPLFYVAMFFPYVLFICWFLVSFALIRELLGRLAFGRLRNVSVLCLAAATFLPDAEIPPLFKYDFLARILLLIGILVLVLYLKRPSLGFAGILTAIGGAIVLTHSVTALVWVAFLVLTLGGILLLGKSRLIGRATSWSPPTRNQLVRCIVFVITLTGLWWLFYTKFFLIYILTNVPKLSGGVSFNFLSFVRVTSSTQATLSSATPSWLLFILASRNYLILGLLLLGLLVILFRPKLFVERDTVLILLVSIVITIVMEVDSSVNLGDRAIQFLSPMLAIMIIIPLGLLSFKAHRLVKLGSFLILGIIAVSLGLGLWGASYAPVYVYSGNSNPQTFGEHPLQWSGVGNFMAYNSNYSCVITNEVYVTSLIVPATDYISLHDLQGAFPSKGCIFVIYYDPESFNQSYIAEPPGPAIIENKFTYGLFSLLLYGDSNQVFSTGNSTVSYYLG